MRGMSLKVLFSESEDSLSGSGEGARGGREFLDIRSNTLKLCAVGGNSMRTPALTKRLCASPDPPPMSHGIA